MVNVYIKDPVVTRILRDEKIPVIAFVANTGGLLGLCMGFSLVSVFEIVYHACGTARKKWWQKPTTSVVTNGSTVHNGAFLEDFVRTSIAKQNKGSTRKLTSC